MSRVETVTCDICGKICTNREFAPYEIRLEDTAELNGWRFVVKVELQPVAIQGIDMCASCVLKILNEMGRVYSRIDIESVRRLLNGEGVDGEQGGAR